VTMVAAILRNKYGWQDRIKPDLFRVLGAVVAVLTAFYIYLSFTEQLTVNFAGPHGEIAVSELIISGDLAPLWWGTMVVGFIAPALVLLTQAIRPEWFNTTATVVSSVVLVIAFWIKRFLIVVPSLLRPLLPFQSGTYSPTWIEWSIIAGTFALAVLLYAVFIKVFPIVEAEEK